MWPLSLYSVKGRKRKFERSSVVPCWLTPGHRRLLRCHFPQLCPRECPIYMTSDTHIELGSQARCKKKTRKGKNRIRCTVAHQMWHRVVRTSLVAWFISHKFIFTIKIIWDSDGTWKFHALQHIFVFVLVWFCLCCVWHVGWRGRVVVVRYKQRE